MIQERQLLLCKATGRKFRVVHRDQSRTYLMPAEHKAQGWPDHRNSVELEREAEEGLWSVEKEGTSVAPSTKSMEYAQSTYKTFKDALDDKLALLSPRGRSNLLSILKDANPTIRANTFYKVVRRWLVGGCVVPALAATWVSNSSKLSTESVREMDYETAKKSVRDRAERLMRMGYVPPVVKDHTKSGSLRKRAPSAAPAK